MKLVSLAGVVSAALAVAVSVPAPVLAADLGGYRGSVKDGYQPMPVINQSSAGPCYFRGDVGYSWSNTPDVKWPVHNGAFTGDANANGVIDANEIAYTFLTDKVSNANMENTWLAEGGIGCGWGGSRGVRIEAMLGYRGDRKIDGEPGFFLPAPPVGTPVPGYVPPGPQDDPLHTSVKSYTLMLNA